MLAAVARKERFKYTPSDEALGDKSFAPGRCAVETFGHPAVRVGSDGAVQIDVPDGQVLDEPILINFTNLAVRSDAPLSIRLGRSAKAIVVETITGAGWLNRDVQIELAEGASLHHARLEEKADLVLTQASRANIAAEAGYTFTVLQLGATLARHDLDVFLKGVGASATLNQATAATGAQHADLTATVYHQAPECTSRQNIRTVLAGQARGVYQSKIAVAKVAQKTDAFQLSKAILLSPFAEMDTKPELEIFADDVKCSHGATTGALDDAHLFYLQSRGLPQEMAKALLIRGFLAEMLTDLPPQAETCFFAALETWLTDSK